ncbi:glycoside hydrolase [Auricularia subglabra TFB-10046 SS5]|nr:glycoside hydrolase [Auricularia subglabra TFB-10046 SS5]
MRYARIALAVGWLAAAASGKAPRCRLRKRGQLIVKPPHPTSPATPTSSGSGPSQTGSPGGDDGPLPLFNYSTTPIRGVNLGGWFVLEPWITPSIFQATGNDNIIDEYTFGQLQDDDVALKALTAHWESWVVDDDFKAMSDAGLNHVRIPLGYWSVPQEESVAPYVPGAYPYFRNALAMARKHGLYVILDLHGAPGSQNGYDNSGQRRPDPQWANDPDNVARTINIIHDLAKDVGDQIAVVQLLNEIAGYTSPAFANAARLYWQKGYAAVRDGAGNNVQVMIGDAFFGVQAWTDFMQPPDYRGVLMDFHEYQIFSIPELQRSFDDHISYACNLGSSLAAYSSSNLWTVVGEWSLAITDCTFWLNGRGVGARWDGTYYPGSDTVTLGQCEGLSMDSSKFSDDYKAFLRRYWEVQVHIGEMSKGWIFWTWKAENSDEWSYKVGVEKGWIPSDPSDRLYPNICG